MTAQGVHLPSAGVERARVDRQRLPDAAESGRLYAIVESYNDPAFPTQVERLGPAIATCLERGHLAVGRLAERAPYLIQLNRERLDGLLSTYGHRTWGVFVLSAAPLKTLKHHFRKWLHVQTPDGEAQTFRFYRPQVLPRFLPACNEAEAKAFFGPCAAFWIFSPKASEGIAFTPSPTLDDIAPLRLPVGDKFRFRPSHLGALRGPSMQAAWGLSFERSGMIAKFDDRTGELSITDAEGRKLRLGFDASGNLSTLTTASGRQWTTRHDPSTCRCLGLTTPSGLQIDLEPRPDGKTTRILRDGVLRCTEHYDALDRFAGIRYPDGTARQITYLYNDRDRIGQRVATTTNRLGHTERWRYDANGDIDCITDARGHTVRYAYGRYCRPTGIHHPDGRVEQFDYDPNGQIVEIKTADGTLGLSYTDQSQLQTLTGSDGLSARFAYNDQGQITQANTGTVQSLYLYDPAGRLIEERQGPHKLQYHYDKSGTLSRLTLPSGETHRYSRDAEGRLIELQAWNEQRYTIDYAQNDKAWRLVTPSGLVLTHILHPAGFPLRQTVHAKNGGAVLSDRQLVYDAEDRLSQCSDSRLGQQTYAYDAEGQVLASRGPYAESFTYDAAGNRITANGIATAYTASNGITRDDVNYDARGNLIAQNGWHYTYNSRNQLTQAKTKGLTVTYAYDAFGRRLKKTVDRPDPRTGSTHRLDTETLWQGEQRLQETVTECWHQGQGSIITAGPTRVRTDEWLYWPGTSTPLLLRRSVPGKGRQVYLYETDHLGTPIRLHDLQGTVVWEAQYHVFGEAIIKLDTLEQPLRFPGHYYDQETGLHENRFRYYDPKAGRYLSPDPLGTLNGLNLYRYAQNNPLNQADPLGLFSFSGFLNFATPIVAVAAVIILAPAVTPLAILTAGALAGATFFGVSEALNKSEFCFSCIGLAALKGGGIGALASLPVLVLPAGAGVTAFLSASGASGGLNYAGEWVANGSQAKDWSWRGFTGAIALGAATAGLYRSAGNVAARAKAKGLINARYRQLEAEGHGPQRHEGQVTEQNLHDRCTKGIDPMTGTTTDGVTGETHAYGRHATKVNTAEDYVDAENKIRQSEAFKKETQKADIEGKVQAVVKDQKLEDIYGSDYQSKVSGRSRIGSAKDPQGSTPTDFTNGTMVAVYNKQSNGGWTLTTMYPNPQIVSKQ